MGRIGIFLFLIFCLGFSETQQESQILDFNMVSYSKEGEKSWELKGRSADIFSDEVKLKDLEANFYGKENVTLKSKEGIFERQKNFLRLEKDVKLTTETGASLETDSLNYDEKKGVLTSEDKVEIQKEDILIEGNGLEAKPDLKRAIITKDIVVDVQTNPKRKIQISCDGPLKIDYGKRIAIFNKNVKVEDIEGNIISDTMEVYFYPSLSPTEKDKIKAEVDISENESDRSNWEIDKIIAKGNVKIVRGENISYSQEAIYDTKEKKVTLIGQPRLIIYSEEEISLP